jgi:HEAT repeat protein
MRHLLRLTVLAAGLLVPAEGFAQTRTRIRMPWGQTGFLTDRPAPPLGRLIKDSEDITVLQVAAVDRVQGIITFTPAAALKGKAPADPVRHRFDDKLTADSRRAFLEWARPGRTAVCFRDDGWGHSVCVGNAWYEMKDDGTVLRSAEQFTTTYVGPTDRLREHVVAILAGKEIVVTASATADRDPSPRRPAPRDWLRGQKGRVCRLRAGLEGIYRDREIPLIESDEFIGWGIDRAALPKLVESLKDADAFVRCEAAEDLGQIGPAARPALPDLRRALEDSDAHVRVFAALALARIDAEDRQAVPALLAALTDRDARVRVAAASALAELPTRTGVAVPALLKALQADPNEDVRAAAAFAVGRIASEGTDVRSPRVDVIAALAKAAQDDKPYFVRYWSIHALRRFGPDARAAIPALVRRLKAEEYESDLALDTLSRLGPISVPALCDALKVVKDRDLRSDIFAHLEDLGPSAREAIPTLRGLTESDSFRDRSDAIAALMGIAWKSDAKAVTSALCEAIEGSWLKGPGSMRLMVRSWDLGPGDEAAVPALIAWLKQGDRGVAATIANIGPGARSAIPALRATIEAERGADPQVAYALWCLGHKREAVKALRRQWEHRDKDVRRDDILFVLADFGPDAAEMVPLLKRELRKEPEDYRGRYARACIALALWRIEKPVEAGGVVVDPRQEALDVLLAMLRDKYIDSMEALAAMEALGQIGPEAKAAVPVLIKATKRVWWDTRIYAVRALGRTGIGTKDVTDALAAALKDRNMEVRAEAALALTRLDRRSAPIAVMVEVIERRPSLLSLLADTLGEFGADAKPAVPVLLRLLRDEDRNDYLAAARLLRKLDPKAAERAGVP